MRLISLPAYRSWRSTSTYHVVGKVGVSFTTTAHTTKSVEHAGAEEANEGHHRELKFGRRIVNAESRVQDLVLPSAGEKVPEGQAVLAVANCGGVRHGRRGLDRNMACLFSLFRHLELQSWYWMQVLEVADAIYLSLEVRVR
jgi:hypothetical protein